MPRIPMPVIGRSRDFVDQCTSRCRSARQRFPAAATSNAASRDRRAKRAKRDGERAWRVVHPTTSSARVTLSENSGEAKHQSADEEGHDQRVPLWDRSTQIAAATSNATKPTSDLRRGVASAPMNRRKGIKQKDQNSWRFG